MTEVMQIIMPIALAIFSALVSIIILMLRKAIERVEKLEERIYAFISREDARIMINEKLDPVHKQIAAIDQKLDKIIDIMLNDK